ncbi:hypothetical protein ACTHOQ_12135 [Solibacillus silvestris]
MGPVNFQWVILSYYFILLFYLIEGMIEAMFDAIEHSFYRAA